MKYIVIIISFLATSFLFGQTSSEIQKSLAEHLNKMTYYKFQAPNDDSVNTYNTLFKKLFLKYLGDDPSSMRDNMDIIVKAGLIIASSEDKQFRIYSWDTQSGGTMHFYDNVYQYAAGDKVFVKESMNDTEGDPKSWYSEIYTMKDKEKKYYLGVYNAEYSTRDIAQGIKFFAIENNSLNTDVKLAKTTDGNVNELGISFNFFSLQNHDERPLKLVLFDKSKNTISVPVVQNENDSITNKLTLYQYQNGLFEKVK
ncbi:MAG: hypothetical protein ABI543_13805 [Ignavibacteria bacterium]